MANEQFREGFDTVYIKEEISKCEDLEDLKKEILPMIKSQKEQWTQKVNDIITENGYTKSRFAELCGVSRVTVDKWCKGALPRNRETFLRIGMVANYDVEKMNQLLQRYGRLPALYSKSLEDCICIYVLENNSELEKIEQYQYILEKIRANINREELAETENISTVKFDTKLSEVKDEDELERFIMNNSAMFSYSYHKFYTYVKICIEANIEGYATSVFDMAEAQGWSSSLRQCVSAIYQNKWYPTRNKIISLGLHLSMEHDQIDEMLQLAHMEPLCSKNIFESIIMFVLDNASLNNMLDTESDEYDPDELCRYTKEVLEELDFPEVEFFISEISEVDDAW